MLKSLQSFRGIFAIFIFLHHLAGFTAGGDSGVAFFLILSGFVLGKGYGKRIEEDRVAYISFMGKRIAKIYPLHLLCLFAAIVLQMRMINGEILLAWLSNALLMQSWIPLKEFYFSGNAVAWCLSDLLFCYALFPFVMKFISCRNPLNIMKILFAILAVYFVVILMIPSRYANSVIYVNPLFRFLDFILGVILCTQGVYLKKFNTIKGLLNLSIGWKTVVESIPLGILAVAVVLYPHIPVNIATASFWWVPSLLIIAVYTLLEGNGGWITRLLHSRIMVDFGYASFCFYMIHLLVYQYSRILLMKLDITMPLWLFLAVEFIICTIGAHIIHKYFETPMSRLLLRRKVSGKI